MHTFYRKYKDENKTYSTSQLLDTINANILGHVLPFLLRCLLSSPNTKIYFGWKKVLNEGNQTNQIQFADKIYQHLDNFVLNTLSYWFFSPHPDPRAVGKKEAEWMSPYMRSLHPSFSVCYSVQDTFPRPMNIPKPNSPCSFPIC